jgi:hypothetical protein
MRGHGQWQWGGACLTTRVFFSADIVIQHDPTIPHFSRFNISPFSIVIYNTTSLTFDFWHATTKHCGFKASLWSAVSPLFSEALGQDLSPFAPPPPPLLSTPPSVNPFISSPSPLYRSLQLSPLITSRPLERYKSSWVKGFQNKWRHCCRSVGMSKGMEVDGSRRFKGVRLHSGGMTQRGFEVEEMRSGLETG